MSKNYYFVQEDGYIAKKSTIGFTPRNAIMQVPPEADPETWDIIEVEDKLSPELKRKVIQPNPDKIKAKEDREAARKLEQEERKTNRKAREKTKEDLLESLKAVRTNGPLKDVVDFILLTFNKEE